MSSNQDEFEFIENNEENFNKLLSVFIDRQVDALKNASEVVKNAVVMAYNNKNIDKILLKRVLSAICSIKIGFSFDFKYSLPDEEVDQIIKNPDSHYFESAISCLNKKSASDFDSSIDKSKLH